MKVCKLLLEAGGDVDARTVFGDTAVFYAARWGTYHVVEFLLDRGICVDKPKGT